MLIQYVQMQIRFDKIHSSNIFILYICIYLLRVEMELKDLQDQLVSKEIR